MLKARIPRAVFPSHSTHKLLFRFAHAMPPLTLELLNPSIKNVQYAVRGELAIKSEEYRVKLKNGETLPFNKVISSNIGNPQQKGLDQPPITFTRQVCWQSSHRLKTH
jgi:alanine transaminase